MSDVTINVEHLTRVEGHGNIIVNAKNGKVEKILWEVSEAPRFFEAFVRNKPYDQLAQITSRICGICSIGHSLASLKATEDAMNITISDQSQKLRRLAIHGENMQSHILHIGYLVAPDLFGVGSVFPLIDSHTAVVKKIISLHRLANEFSNLICGRTTHPINLVVGGMYKTPSPDKLKDIRQKLYDCIPTVREVAAVVKKNAAALPDFHRETEYIALSAKKEYALYDGDLNSTDAGIFSDYKNYHNMTNEYVVPQSTAKYTKNKRKSYMVGALARFNLNSKQLHPIAKEVADMFNLKPVNYNPYMNTIAQLVEFAHSIEDSLSIIDSLLEKGLVNEKPVQFKIKAGRGVGLVEVPRGLLIHDYTYDAKGYCTKANCIIPTNQNHANIQHDMEELVPQIIDTSEKEIELTLEMLVRAYDPCISCSTHYLKVSFV